MSGNDGSRRRLALGIAATIAFLALVLAGILGVVWAWQKSVRETAPTLLEWPGGGWTVGAVGGAIAVGGVVGGRMLSRSRGPRRLPRTAAATACRGLALATLVYMWGFMPVRNCDSPSCESIPGSGTALLAYALTAAALGWPAHRALSARDEARTAQQRERLRRLRKRGKGKSRAARSSS